MPTSNWIKVSCRSCGLLTKIEKSNVLPPCSECGGTLVPIDAPLRAEPTPPPEPLKGVRFCPACEASNPETARFCENCGAPMVEQATETKPRSKSLEKRHANIELGKAFRTMKWVRGLFIVLAVLYGLALAVVFVGFLGLQRRGGGVPGLYAFLLFYVACTFSVFIVGAVFLRRQPFAWTLSLACLMTVDVVLTTFASAATDGFTLLSVPWLWVFLTIGCWTATASMLNVKKLLAEHGDTVGAQRFAGTYEPRHRPRPGPVRQRRKPARDRAPGEISNKVRSRAREAAGRSTQKVAIYGVGILVASVLVVWLVVSLASKGGGDNTSSVHAYDAVEAAKKREQLENSYEPVLDRFLTAWRASDKNAIAEMASPGASRSLIRRLENSLGRYELPTDKLPGIRSRRDLWLRRVDGVKTYFAVPATEGRMRPAKLRLHWVFSEEGKWVLISAHLTGRKRDN